MRTRSKILLGFGFIIALAGGIWTFLYYSASVIDCNPCYPAVDPWGVVTLLAGIGLLVGGLYLRNGGPGSRASTG